MEQKSPAVEGPLERQVRAPLRKRRVNRAEDHEGQKIDDVCYVGCNVVVAMSGRSRTSVFYDIRKGLLPAVWGKVVVNGKADRAWLVHPNDAAQYAMLHKHSNVY